jgi:hypothetical protein
MICRNAIGALCGYVGLPPGHPSYGVHYDSVGAAAHEGLTFSGESTGHICYQGESQSPGPTWWLGFDCAHYYDLSPLLRSCGGEYRDLAWVKAETEHLARQLTRASN